MSEISLKGLSKASVLAALYNAAQPLGMGFVYDPTPMSEEEAEKILVHRVSFNYLKGRVMKVDLSGDTFNPWLYDAYNGQGVAQAAIDKLQPGIPGQSFGSKIKTALSWGNVSKLPTTLLAILVHFGIGIYRLVSLFILAIMFILVAFKIAFGFVRRAFSVGYENTWNLIYARIAAPTCQICGERSTKDHPVVFAEDDDCWNHFDCKIAREVAILLNDRRHEEAAIIMAMSKKAEKPLPLKIVVQSLRALKDPYTHGLYGMVCRLKARFEKMDSIDIFVGILSVIG
jgi:hypothetical protein